MAGVESPDGLQHKVLRFEDLGEPVQKLLKELRGDVDTSLLQFISVREMAMIFNAQAQQVQAEKIWQDLKPVLEAKRSKQLGEKFEKQVALHEAERNSPDKKRLEEEEKRRKELERRKQAEEEEQRRKAAEAEQQRQREEQQRLENEKRRLEEEKRRQEEEERLRKLREAEELERQQLEQQKRALEEERNRLAEERKRAEEERKRLDDERLETERKRKQDEEAQQRAWAEEQHRKVTELRQKMIAEQEALARQLKQKEEEAAALRAERERLERERIERDQRLETERKEREKLELEMAERRKMEQERLENERKEQERLAALEKQRREVEEDYARKEAERQRAHAENERRAREIQQKLEAEKRHILAQKEFAMPPNAGVEWRYFSSDRNLWTPFPPQVGQILEEAYAADRQICVVPGPDGGNWNAHLPQMLAVTSTNARIPIHRQKGDEVALPEQAGPRVVWSSNNPFTQKWERFPNQLSRILEVKFQNGHPSAEILVMSTLRFTIFFKEMKQIDEQQRYRHVGRSIEYPAWQRFNPLGQRWETISSTDQIEETFATGTQYAEIVDERSEIDFGAMRVRGSDGSFWGLRRHMTSNPPTTASASSAAGATSVFSSSSSSSSPSSGASLTFQSTSQPRLNCATPTTLTTSQGSGVASVAAAPPPIQNTSQMRGYSHHPPQLALLEYDAHSEEIEKVLSGLISFRQHALKGGLNSIGRLPAKDPSVHSILIDRPDVSRAHCLIDFSVSTGELFIEDCRSTSGTYVRGSAGEFQQLKPEERYRLSIGVFLSLGNSLAQIGMLQ